MFDPKKQDSDGDGINDSEEARLLTEASFHLFSLLIFSPIVLAVTLILSKRARNRSKNDKV